MIEHGTYLRNVHITLRELSEFPSVVFYFVILYKNTLINKYIGQNF